MIYWQSSCKLHMLYHTLAVLLSKDTKPIPAIRQDPKPIRHNNEQMLLKKIWKSFSCKPSPKFIKQVYLSVKEVLFSGNMLKVKLSWINYHAKSIKSSLLETQWIVFWVFYDFFFKEIFNLSWKRDKQPAYTVETSSWAKYQWNKEYKIWPKYRWVIPAHMEVLEAALVSCTLHESHKSCDTPCYWEPW